MSSDKHYIWKDVEKNGKIVKQRFYIKNREDVITPSENPFGKDSYFSAELKDRIIQGYYYNNVFYDTKGERIQLSPEQYQEAIKKFTDPSVLFKGSPQYKKIIKERREHILKLIPIIELKDKYFLKEIARREKTTAKFNTIENRLHVLQNLIDKIEPNSFILNIEKVCNDIKLICSNTNFNVVIERNNKVSTIPFEIFYDSIKKYTNKYLQPHIIDFKIEGMETFDISNFKQIKTHIKYSDIYNIVNKKIEKIRKKDNENSQEL